MKKKEIYFVLGVCINIDFFPLYPIFPAEIRNISSWCYMQEYWCFIAILHPYSEQMGSLSGFK